MKNTLTTNMRRFGTKNLDEQIATQSVKNLDKTADPIEIVLNSLEMHAFRMQQMYDEYSRKYASLTVDPTKSKGLALGMMKKIENADKIYHDAVKQVYNM